MIREGERTVKFFVCFVEEEVGVGAVRPGPDNQIKGERAVHSGSEIPESFVHLSVRGLLRSWLYKYMCGRLRVRLFSTTLEHDISR